MPNHARRIIELEASEIPGLQKGSPIARLVAELDENGVAGRELGYDELGRLVHRWPGGESLAPHSLLSSAVVDASTPTSMESEQFDTLWREAIEEEEFFAEHDPFGERFGTTVPWWGCLITTLVVGLVVYGLYRLAIWLGFAWSVSA